MNNSVHCILQDYVRGGYPSSPGIRCWYTGDRCMPDNNKCDNYRKNSSKEIALREAGE